LLDHHDAADLMSLRKRHVEWEVAAGVGDRAGDA
jgi:hypothetical protein